MTQAKPPIVKAKRCILSVYWSDCGTTDRVYLNGLRDKQKIAPVDCPVTKPMRAAFKYGHRPTAESRIGSLR